MHTYVIFRDDVVVVAAAFNSARRLICRRVRRHIMPCIRAATRAPCCRQKERRPAYIYRPAAGMQREEGADRQEARGRRRHYERREKALARAGAAARTRSRLTDTGRRHATKTCCWRRLRGLSPARRQFHAASRSPVRKPPIDHCSLLAAHLRHTPRPECSANGVSIYFNYEATFIITEIYFYHYRDRGFAAARHTADTAPKFFAGR